MEPKDYLSFYSNGKDFYITKSDKKAPTTSALQTLKNIEYVMRSNLNYTEERGDEFSKLSKDKLRAKLKDVAKEIKAQFHEKASHASIFARIFGGISRQEKAIDAVFNRIENLESPPTFDLPNDAIKNILSHLDLKDIANVKQVSKTSEELANEVQINRAREYGYKGNDYKEAKEHLSNLRQAVKSYSISPELKDKGIFVKKGPWYSKHLDVEATLKKMKALSPTEKNAFIGILQKNLNQYLDRNSEEDLQSIKNTCALLQLLDVKLDDHLIKMFNSKNPKPNAKIVKFLLDSGADVNARNEVESTPLMYLACYNPDPEAIKLLLESGADVNAVYNDGSTPLMLLSKLNPYPVVIKLLLDSGADVNATSQGQTSLMILARYNANPEAIQLLLDKGADVNARNKVGSTPLMFAARHNPNGLIIELLLANRADVNAIDDKGMTPLLYALKFNPNPEIIAMLVKNGARTDVADKDGNTAFDLLFANFKKG